jgi:hypothetical protein
MTTPNVVLNLKSDFSAQRYRKYTRIDEKISPLKDDLFLNSHANFG